jgi:hypothetical protein
MAATANDARLQTQVVHCLSSWLSAYAIPQAFLMSSKLLCIPFSALVSGCPTTVGNKWKFKKSMT